MKGLNQNKKYDSKSRRVWNWGNLPEIRRQMKTKKILKDKKIMGSVSSFSTGEFSLYFYSFQTDIIKVYFVTFSFSRKMGNNSGLVSYPLIYKKSYKYCQISK